jgi:glycine betaine/proline transport system substrate-binding protein
MSKGYLRSEGESWLITRRSLLMTGASAMICKGSWFRATSIILGQVSLSFYAVAGAVVQEVLEGLGYTVELRQGPHEEIFPLLGNGSIDLMAAAWLPEGHRRYWEKYGQNAKEVAKLYDGARFFWAVPDYVPESEVTSIDDLAKDPVAKLMTKTIQGIGTGATITTDSQTTLREYGLDGLGYMLKPGTAAEWTEAYDSAVAQRRWIVFPTWTPQYLNRDGNLRPLRDPKGTLGGVNHASLVGPRDRLRRISPSTIALLSRINLGLDGVTEMDWIVNVQKKSPRYAAQQWMRANQQKVSTWLHD